MLENKEKLNEIASQYKPDIIIHLAAQAGVRYSLINPDSYISSNILGTFNIMEIARKLKVKHLLMASTSSVYGANSNLPFSETDQKKHSLQFMLLQKKLMKIWRIRIQIYGKYQPRCYVFLQFMDHGEDLIWLFLNLLRQF